MTKKGFTLIEVMIVVVIALAVTAFSVPAYKKAQLRNQYTAAQGVLIQVASGIRSLYAQYPDSVRIYGAISNSWESGSSADTCEKKGATDLTCAKRLLFTAGFVTSLPFSSTTYKGYTYYACSGSTGGGCCGSAGWPSDMVACMTGGTAPYKGAYVTDAGNLVLKQS